MEPNQYPPSEREWTPQEMEEFFAGQDAVTGLFREATAINTPVGEWTITEMAEWWNQRGIHVTSIVPPAQGWPIAMHCPICRETTFLLSPWAAKPEKGDYWLMKETCGSDVLCEMHNIQMAYDKMFMEILRHPISPKSIYGYDPTEEK
jgi:hypothetical protein